MTGPRDLLILLILLTLEPRPKFQTMLKCARTTRMNVITLPDHRYLASAQRFSKLVISCQVATFGRLPSHATMVSMNRFLSITFIGQVGEAGHQRLAVIEDIIEEIDLFE